MFGIKSKCKLHDTDLEKGSVNISYGLIRFAEDYLAAKENLFPNSKSYVLGGCMISDDNEKNAEVEFCSLCRAAEINWKSENQPDKS